MKYKLILPYIYIIVAMVTICFSSCSKTNDSDNPPTPLPTTPTTSFDPALTTGTLKDAANFPAGIAIGYDLFKNNTAYANVVKTEFDNVTFEYQMKHGAIVKTNGTKDYSKTDDLANLVTAGGLQIFGHVLAWYQNNNGDFLRSFASVAEVDSVLKDWVQGMVNRYKDKVHAWDAVNEPFTDGSPVFRTGTSTGDTYYWAQYLGRGYVAKVFNYARQADATCDLFLNDYNLESNPAKLDSIIALANELKTQSVPVTGIGTQMHISINTSQSGIDNMFMKLAATGLKIRISELDIRLNPSNTAGFVSTTALLESQAAMYKYVLASFVKNVPAAQRFGATVWNVGDNDSWIVAGGQTDFPTLFNSSYQKKYAYTGFWLGVK